MTWEYKRKGRWYIRKGLLKTRRKPRKRSFAVLRDNNNHQMLHSPLYPQCKRVLDFNLGQEERELQMAIEASKREVSMRSDLPSGWEEKRDPSTGKYFYIDHVNKRTQWEKPKIMPDPSLPPAYDECVPSQSTTQQTNNADVSHLT